MMRLAYSLDEVAGALGLSVRTIERRCADGTFQPIRVGGVRRIPAEQLRALLGQTEEQTDRSPVQSNDVRETVRGWLTR